MSTRPREFHEAKVAGRNLRAEPAERAPCVDVGRGGRDLDVRAARRAHAHHDLVAPEVEAEHPAPALDVDDDLVPVAALAKLDARVLDHLADFVAVAGRVELDRGLLAVHRFDLDLPRGQPEVE